MAAGGLQEQSPLEPKAQLLHCKKPLPSLILLPAHPLSAQPQPPPPSLKKYDIAGDGITTRDFITITSGAGAVEFCKGQCAGIPDCEFTVTQLTKCYIKNNIGQGTYGKTGASPSTDATCVKGADSWLKFALQVSNQPAAGMPLPGGIPGAPGAGGIITALPPRRNGSMLGNGAQRGAELSVGAAAVASIGGWLLAALLAG